VEQTIAMIRDSAEWVFECGPGWVADDQPEEYWVKVRRHSAAEKAARGAYCVSIYGIFADPARSVPRCLVRELVSGRVMLVQVLLKSLRLFAANFVHYCDLVDDAVLFDNNVFVDLERGELPPTSARKEARSAPLEVLDEASFDSFKRHRLLNVRATSLDTLYETPPENGTPRTEPAAVPAPSPSPSPASLAPAASSPQATGSPVKA
jgi:hypothetical protein